MSSWIYLTFEVEIFEIGRLGDGCSPIPAGSAGKPGGGDIWEFARYAEVLGAKPDSAGAGMVLMMKAAKLLESHSAG